SGHRDTGPTACPGNGAYALLPTFRQQVARTGLPKLYAPVVSGALGGDIRFQARLSATLPWTVMVSDAKGKVVARRSGDSQLVDWARKAAAAGNGPLAWSIPAGAGVQPATGTPRGPLPA